MKKSVVLITMLIVVLGLSTACGNNQQVTTDSTSTTQEQVLENETKVEEVLDDTKDLGENVETEEDVEAEENVDIQETAENVQEESNQKFLVWYDGDKNLTDLYWKWESDSEWQCVFEQRDFEAGTGVDFQGEYKEEAFMVKMTFEDGEAGEATLSVEDVMLSKAEEDEMDGYLVFYIYPIGIWR